MREQLSAAGNNALKDERRVTSEMLEETARRLSTILGGSRRAKRRKPSSHPDLYYCALAQTSRKITTEK